VPGYEASVWYGVVAPARTPREIILKLNAETAKVINDRANRDKLAASDFEATQSTPAEFGAFIRAETAKWSKVVKASGARAD
jgi:tripartite-type tricarboxylate transporter receptor subunit TctC